MSLKIKLINFKSDLNYPNLLTRSASLMYSGKLLSRVSGRTIALAEPIKPLIPNIKNGNCIKYTSP